MWTILCWAILAQWQIEEENVRVKYNNKNVAIYSTLHFQEINDTSAAAATAKMKCSICMADLSKNRIRIPRGALSTYDNKMLAKYFARFNMVHAQIIRQRKKITGEI